VCIILSPSRLRGFVRWPWIARKQATMSRANR
jgi:hypothetical protein